MGDVAQEQPLIESGSARTPSRLVGLLRRSRVAWTALALLLLVCAMSLVSRREKDPDAVFRKSKDALVKIYLDVEVRLGEIHDFKFHDFFKQHAGGKSHLGRVGVGFFISKHGTVLTAAHHIPATNNVVLVYTDKNGTSASVGAHVWTRDADLDLALIEPDQPISPARFLKPTWITNPHPANRWLS